MFCFRRGVKPSKKPILASCSTNSLDDVLDHVSSAGTAMSLKNFHADSNASFLRAARSGNLEKVLDFLKGNIDINTSNANGLNALHLAAKEGHVEVVTELLKNGANINAATKKGNTALHIASLAGQDEVVKVLVNLGANVNVQSQNGFTPLYMAAQENHDGVVSFLLANKANQSLATEDGFTPLAVALQQGHDKVVAVLLENDTKGRVRLPALHIAAKKDDGKAATLLLQNDHNPDVTSKSGFTPLHIAAHYGNEKIANILLDKGADVNYAAKHQITPLHVASKWGKTNMVGLLIEKGAKIEAVTRDGLTPLHCAARSGHDQVVDHLLEKGAPILAKTKNGLAPLHMASQGDHVDSARTLLYHKAPVDDVTVDYLTALHVAAHCGHVKVAKLLLDRKADPNARALNGFTPLHIACKKNRIKVVELLLKHGASIEATTESGLSPLHVASFMGCMNIVIYLIQSGANPDVPTVRGETPLHLAARANQIDIIRILLRNGASVDARAREEQTPLHIAARLGNVDIVSLLLQHGAAVDATTKDMYTALHIAAKEGQEEVVAVLLDHEASLVATTKRGFTPLHLAAKYGNIKVVRLLLQKDAPVDAQGKNGLTPLHVAAHYNHVNEALLLLEKGASPHATAKNGYTPLHIAAKKNQMDIATTLLEYGAKCNAESKSGYIPLHLSSQEGHTDMSSLLIENQANVNCKANNGLTPLHLCAQEDRVNVALVLVKNGAEIGPQTDAGYTPLHVASHFGQMNMVRFLLQNNADVCMTTEHGYTPLHQAAQQGHTPVVNLLLENKASPNVTTSQGQTALSIAQRLGYISVVETLKVVTETTVTTTTTTVTEEKYKVLAPEIMQETFMTDSEDEGGGDFEDMAYFGPSAYAAHIYLPYMKGGKFMMREDTMLGDQSYRYLTADEMKSLGDDSLPIDVTKDEKHHEAMHMLKDSAAPMVEEDNISPQHITPIESGFISEKFSPDNIDISRAPVHAGSFSYHDDCYSSPPEGMLRSSGRLKWKTFLVSFMVDARGGAMRGCRHSGVRVIIPPRKASMPMRITCRYLRKEKLIHPPPLMEGEACASRILEVGPIGARFLGPVIIEVPHFASLRGREREVTILRSDTGETWREHSLEASEEAVQDVLNESFEGDELSALEDLNTNRITRILTTDFPQYFAIVTRIRQEVHGVGPEGGMVSSTVVPQVQAIFPEGALQKKIRVGLQAQPIAPELVAKLLGNRVAVSPIVTVEPRRRKFHKPITLTIPVPQAATKGMINQYSGDDAPTLRLLCSITGGSSKAQWEDVTGSTPLTFVNDCVSFTTTVSARFWLMDCRQVSEVSRFATELYQEAVHVPFMAKFVIFAKRHDPNEAQLRVFCMTDDKEDKTLETQEHFTEIAKSRDVEVLEGKLQYLEFAGNLVPVTNSGEQLKFVFHAFHENRLPFVIRVKDPHVEPMGRIAFMKEPKVGRGEPPQTPICNLNIAMPEVTVSGKTPVALELVTLEKKYDFMQEAGLSKPESIHRANLRLSDIARELDKDWVVLANELRVSESDINFAKSEFADDIPEQALTMLRMWLQKTGSKATGNELEKALRKINRADIIKNCMFNVELVTDDVEKAVAKVHLDQSGFDVFKEELGSSRETSMRRGASLDAYDEQDIMKEAELAVKTSSETGSLFERDQISQAISDDKENIQPPKAIEKPSENIENATGILLKGEENVSLIAGCSSEQTKLAQDESLDQKEEHNHISNTTHISNAILEERNNITNQNGNYQTEYQEAQEYIISPEKSSTPKIDTEDPKNIEEDIEKLSFISDSSSKKYLKKAPCIKDNDVNSHVVQESKNNIELTSHDTDNVQLNNVNQADVHLDLQAISSETVKSENTNNSNILTQNIIDDSNFSPKITNDHSNGPNAVSNVDSEVFSESINVGSDTPSKINNNDAVIPAKAISIDSNITSNVLENVSDASAKINSDNSIISPKVISDDSIVSSKPVDDLLDSPTDVISNESNVSPKVCGDDSEISSVVIDHNANISSKIIEGDSDISTKIIYADLSNSAQVVSDDLNASPQVTSDDPFSSSKVDEDDSNVLSKNTEDESNVSFESSSDGIEIAELVEETVGAGKSENIQLPSKTDTVLSTVRIEELTDFSPLKPNFHDDTYYNDESCPESKEPIEETTVEKLSSGENTFPAFPEYSGENQNISSMSTIYESLQEDLPQKLEVSNDEPKIISDRALTELDDTSALNTMSNIESVMNDDASFDEYSSESCSTPPSTIDLRCNISQDFQEPYVEPFDFTSQEFQNRLCSDDYDKSSTTLDYLQNNPYLSNEDETTMVVGHDIKNKSYSEMKTGESEKPCDSTFGEAHRIRRVSKTPPPSPAEPQEREEKPLELVNEQIIVKETTTTVIKTAVPAVSEDQQGVVRKMTESETWPSGELDTSQVSISSLPDDEKSELTTGNVSSPIAEEVGEKIVQDTKEWTEVDESGTVKHVIQKTTHVTLPLQTSSDQTSEDEGALEIETHEPPCTTEHDEVKKTQVRYSSSDQQQQTSREHPELSDSTTKGTTEITEDSETPSAIKVEPQTEITRESDKDKSKREIGENCLELSELPEKEKELPAEIGKGDTVTVSETKLTKTKEVGEGAACEELKEQKITAEVTSLQETAAAAVWELETTEISEEECHREKISESKDKVLIQGPRSKDEPGEPQGTDLCQLQGGILKETVVSPRIDISDDKEPSSTPSTETKKITEPSPDVDQHPASVDQIMEHAQLEDSSEILSKDSASVEFTEDVSEMGETEIRKDIIQVDAPKDSDITTQTISKTIIHTDSAGSFTQTTVTLKTLQHSITDQETTHTKDPSPKTGFVPLAFDNTAFVGAELIDATECAQESRSRSPYEVVRNDHSEDPPTIVQQKPALQEKIASEDLKKSEPPKEFESIKLITKRKSILQHIPSEISEEDLVETEMSPPGRPDFTMPELDEQHLERGTSIQPSTIRTVEYTTIRDVCGEKDDHVEISKQALSETVISKVTCKEIDSKFSIISEILSDEPSGKIQEISSISKLLAEDGEDGTIADAPSEISDTAMPSSKVFTSEEKFDLVSREKTSADMDGLTSPDSDTGMPTSPFEMISEGEISDDGQKTENISQSISKTLSKPGATESHDSFLTSTSTLTLCGDEKTLSVHTDKTLSIHDEQYSEEKELHDIKPSNVDGKKENYIIDKIHSKISEILEDGATDRKDNISQINGPGEMDYIPECDNEQTIETYDISDKNLNEMTIGFKHDEVSSSAKFDHDMLREKYVLHDSEDIQGAVGGFQQKEESLEGRFGDEEKSDILDEALFYEGLPDDVIDTEIGIVIESDAQTEEDIIERPQTPEPPIEPCETVPLNIISETRVTGTIEKVKTAQKVKIAVSGYSVHEDMSKDVPTIIDENDVHTDDDFEIVDESELEAIMLAEANENLAEGFQGNLRKMGSFKDISTVHLTRSLDDGTRDIDGAFSSPLLPSSEGSEGSSGFIYGMQFERDLEEHSEEAMDIDSDQYSEEKDVTYNYGMRFEREHELVEDEIPCYGDLYTHQEEDEEVAEEADKIKLPTVNKAEFDTLAGRKFFAKSCELDDISMSSLQEFERLEEEIRLGRRSSIGSVDSFNGKQYHSKSGEHDDISMNSLTEFEKLERECSEAERMEAVVQEANARLSEIEEGHESQTSEASQETLSDTGKGDYSDDTEDYNARITNIGGIIRKTQSSVEAHDKKLSVDCVDLLSRQIDEKKRDSYGESYIKEVVKLPESSEIRIVTNLDIVPLDNLNLNPELFKDRDALKTLTFDTVDSSAKKQVGGIISSSTTHITVSGTKSKEYITEIQSIKSHIFEDMSLSAGSEKFDDIEQDSLREDRSIKPDSLSGEDKCEYQDSLRDDKSGEVDSLLDEIREDMRDSLHEEKAIEDDSLHEMDILPDESSLSLESSLAAVVDVSHDSLSEKIDVQQIPTERDFDTDSLKGLTLGSALESAFTTQGYEVTIVETGKSGDVMASSIDSLERSNSAATHATYQFETESLMSSSLNSIQTSEDYTMVSSAETFDPETLSIQYENSGNETFVVKDDGQKLLMDSEGNIQTHDFKTLMNIDKDIHSLMKLQDQGGFSQTGGVEVHTCTTTTTMAKKLSEDEMIKRSICPTSHYKTSQDAYSSHTEKDFEYESSQKFDPEVEIEEITTVDEHGNPKLVRKVKRVVRTTHTYTSSSASDDIEEKMKEFLKTQVTREEAGKAEEQIQEEQTFDDKGNVVIVRTVQQQMATDPIVYSRSFKGPDAEKASDDFVKEFRSAEATEDIQEYENVDEDGNIIRVTKQVVLKPEVRTVSFTGPDAQQQMDEYMKQWKQESQESSQTSSSSMTTQRKIISTNSNLFSSTSGSTDLQEEEEAILQEDEPVKSEVTEDPTSISTTTTRIITSMNIQELPVERTVVYGSTLDDVFDPSKQSYDATKHVSSESNGCEDSH